MSADGAGVLRHDGRIVAWREVGADVETPVSAYLKIRRPPHGFLFESVEGGERVGRYSFLGTGPTAVYEGRGRSLAETRGSRRTVRAGDPFELLRKTYGRPPRVLPHLPRFEGGLVGFLGYDAVRHFERLPHAPKDDLHLPELWFGLYETVLVFDHLRHTIRIIAHAGTRADALARVDEAVRALDRPLDPPPGPALHGLGLPAFRTNLTRDRFLRNVVAAKRHIKIGDVIQVVLSQRFDCDYEGDPLTIYRALRVLNPSPYMFFLECGDATLVGSSPEMLVRVEGEEMETRPIAGTRRRGATPAEDLALEKELLADPKERAEHVMLVDLGRNDLGRVCRYGSVRVHDNMVVERYSHVMHLVSGVKGRLAPGRDAFDALRACFPAGTVSGAPKVRAMEIIDDLEPTRRGTYAGIAGYLSLSGNLDTAIAIRTILVKGGKASLQAGMGIVADSTPEGEFKESMAKARAGLLAIAAAQRGGGQP